MKVKKTILVTGGAGMVGTHCAQYFAAQGHRIIVVDNLSRSEIFSSKQKSVEHNWDLLSQLKNVTRVFCDIRDFPELRKCFVKYYPGIVIHTASQPGVRASVENPQLDFSINAAGTVHALEALRQTDVRGTFIYCSTNKVYGEAVNSFPIEKKSTRYTFRNRSGIDERSSIDQTGHTPYGVSKLAGDLYVQDYAHTFGLKTAVFRMSCVYGTQQFAFEDHGWIAWFALRALKGEPVSVFGDGRQVRDVLWVGDLVSVFDQFIQSPLTHGVFNMGGGSKNTISILELIKILEEITGRRMKVAFKKARPFDQKIYVSDIRKVCRELDWRPVVTPREGIARIVSWLKNF